MSRAADARRPSIADDSSKVESLSTHAKAKDQPVCSCCHGTGMEVVPGRGARRCRCRTENRQGRLLEEARTYGESGRD
jgi:hypothetical protein